jgi:hypothetical protein
MRSNHRIVPLLALTLCAACGKAGNAPPAAAPAAAAPPKCEEALVSPVSGYAVCVKPPGAPVDPPPPRPQAPQPPAPPPR